MDVSKQELLDEIEDYYIFLDVKDEELKRKGLQKITYVNDPAIDQVGVYLNSHLKYIKMDDTREVLPDELVDEVLNHLEKEAIMIDPRWVLVTEQEMIDNCDTDSNINLSINTSSSRDLVSRDGKGIYMVRYRYTGPKDSKNRNFCAVMMSRSNYLYTEEAIKFRLTNPEFGVYDVFRYKGNFGCRHKWSREIYYVPIDGSEAPERVRSYNQDVVAVTSMLDDKEARTLNANLSVIEKEKQQVIAPLLIPDIKIYREDEKTGKKYNIIFKDKVIRTIRNVAKERGDLDSKELFKDTHEGDIVSSYIIDEWIVENSNDKVYTEYGFTSKEIPLGTWMIHSQITDKAYFEEIKKKGKYAYSIEAFLDLIKIEEAKNAQLLSKNKLVKDMSNKQKTNVKLSNTIVIDGKEYVITPVEKTEMESTEEEEVEMETTEEEVQAESTTTPEEKEEVEMETTEEEVKAESKEEEVEAESESTEEEVEAETVVDEEEKTELAALKDEIGVKLEEIYEEIAELKAKFKASANGEETESTEEVKMSKAQAFAKMKLKW